MDTLQERQEEQVEDDVVEQQEENETRIVRHKGEVLADLLVQETKQLISIKEEEDAVVRLAQGKTKEIDNEMGDLKHAFQEHIAAKEEQERGSKATELRAGQTYKQMMHTIEIVKIVQKVVNDTAQRVADFKQKTAIQDLEGAFKKLRDMERDYGTVIQRNREDVSHLRNEMSKFDHSDPTWYTNEIEAIKAEIAQMRKKLKEQQERTQMKKKYQEAKDLLEKLSKQRDEGLQSLKTSKDKLEEVKKACEMADEECEKARKQVEEDRQEKMKRLEALKQKRRDTAASIENVMQSITDKQAQIEAQKNKRQDLELKLHEMTTMLAQTKEECQSKIELKKSELEGKQKALSEVEQEYCAVMEKQRTLKADLANKRDVLMDLSHETIEWKVKIVDVQHQMKEEEIALMHAEHRRTIDAETLEHLKAMQQDLHRAAEAKQKQADADRVRQQAALQAIRDQAEQRRKQVEAQVEENNKKYDYLKASQDYMTGKRNQLEERVREANEHLNAKKEESVNVERLLQEKEKKVEAVQKRYQELKMQAGASTSTETGRSGSGVKVLPGSQQKEQQTQKVAESGTTVTEPPTGILKSPHKPATPTKKVVSFKGVPSFESTDHSEDMSSQPHSQVALESKSFDQILRELREGVIIETTAEESLQRNSSPRRKKTRFSP